jgi:hypothetical protein
LKTYGIPLKYLCCDNVGKILLPPLKESCLENEVILEFIAPYIPQQNGVTMERQFTVLVNGANAMMIVASLNKLTRKILQSKASICTKDTESVTISSVHGVSTQESVMGTKPEFLAYLVQWRPIRICKGLLGMLMNMHLTHYTGYKIQIPKKWCRYVR